MNYLLCFILMNIQPAFYTKDVDKDNVKILQVDRESLWQRALIFYKSTPRKDLYCRLSISFEGFEDAIDAGGIRIEFFGDLIRHMNNILFEGKVGHHVPRHSWDKVNPFMHGRPNACSLNSPRRSWYANISTLCLHISSIWWERKICLMYHIRGPSGHPSKCWFDWILKKRKYIFDIIT